MDRMRMLERRVARQQREIAVFRGMVNAMVTTMYVQRGLSEKTVEALENLGENQGAQPAALLAALAPSNATTGYRVLDAVRRPLVRDPFVRGQNIARRRLALPG